MTIELQGRLVSSIRLPQQNTPDWVAYKQQKSVSRSSGSWESELMVPALSRFGEDPLLGCQLLAVSSHGGEQKRSKLSHDSHTGTYSIPEGSI